MSLHEFAELEQGSEEWLAARRGMITASTIGRLITPKTIKPAGNPDSRALVAELAAERIAGWSEPNYVNGDMQRGNDCESIARDRYGEHYGVDVTVMGFMVRDDWGFSFGYSPDGLVADDGLIEIKAPRMKTHIQTIISGEVPPEYMAQCQAGLIVSGREWVDFISFYGGLPLKTIRVQPEQRWVDAIRQASQDAELAIESMVNRYQGAVIGLPETERIIFDNLGLVF